MLIQKKVLDKTRIILLVTLLGTPLFLASCSSDFGPFSMPSGYAHHAKKYKAPPGPEPVFQKWKRVSTSKTVQEPILNERIASPKPPPAIDPESVPMVMSSLDISPFYDNASGNINENANENAWDNAAYDLLTGLVGRFGQPTEPVYINTPEQSPTAQRSAEQSLENALRTAMREKGFNLTEEKGMGPYTLYYTARALNDNDRNSPMTLTLSLRDKDKELAEQSGVYYDLGYEIGSEFLTEPNEEASPAITAPLSIRPVTEPEMRSVMEQEN